MLHSGMLCLNMDSATAEGDEWPGRVSNWLIVRKALEEIKWKHDPEGLLGYTEPQGLPRKPINRVVGLVTKSKEKPTNICESKNGGNQGNTNITQTSPASLAPFHLSLLCLSRRMAPAAGEASAHCKLMSAGLHNIIADKEHEFPYSLCKRLTDNHFLILQRFHFTDKVYHDSANKLSDSTGSLNNGASPTPALRLPGSRARDAASQKPGRENRAVSHGAEWNHWLGKEAACDGLCLEDLYFKQATANIKGEQIHYQQSRWDGQEEGGKKKKEKDGGIREEKKTEKRKEGERKVWKKDKNSGQQDRWMERRREKRREREKGQRNGRRGIEEVW
ncbi:hypothetical protein IHE44_0011295 [Lamprotornis superbus]|uniref:Uncharacterized protein n=1 Tax=Lamprotornis superbus TaxID=245042 RepID=A0A835TRX4_9PASS|nr:hypothetical protein IHE44_0011295 [Lamprotornis superbus]